MSKRKRFLLAGLFASGAILLAVTALSIQTDRLAAALGVVVSSSSSNADVQALFDDWLRVMRVDNAIGRLLFMALCVGGLPLAILAAAATGRPSSIKWLSTNVTAVWACLTLQLTVFGFGVLATWVIAMSAPLLVTALVVAYLGVNLWAIHAWRELLSQLTRPVASQAI